MKNDEKILSFLNNIPLLQELTLDSVLNLLLSSRIMHFKKRDIIYKNGDPANWFYLIFSGHIAEFVSYRGSVEVIVKTKVENEYLGEMGILINESYPNTAIALDNLTLVGIPKEYFWILITKNQSVLHYINKELINRLVNSSRKNISTMYLNAPGKLAFTLLNLCDSATKLEDNTQVYITHNELAATSGMARQTASSLLSNWNKSGIVETLRGSIIINNKDGLMDIIIDSELN